MSKEYELRTIKDIFDLVPADRWETCLTEMLSMFRHNAEIRDMARSFGESVGVVDPTVEFQERVVWIDDDKAELTTTLSSTADEARLVFKNKL